MLKFAMLPGELHFGKLHQNLLDVRSHVEKLVVELHKALLKSHEQKKDLRKDLDKTEVRNKELEKELEESENQKKELNKELERSEAQKKELDNIVLEQRTTLLSYEDQIKDIKNELDQVGSDKWRNGIMTKERDDLISNYNQALKQRDSALAKLNIIGSELKEAQNDLELGKKVWEAERIALAERLTNAKEVWEAERTTLAERLTNAKEVWEAEKIALINKILTKERKDSTCKYNQALKERDIALNELNILEAELNEVRMDLSKSRAELELGKKLREAERMELTKKLNKDFNKFGTEIKEIRKELSDLEKTHKKHIQENENAYCAGYLTGWFKEPHAYMPLPSHEAKEVTIPDQKPLEATYSLSHARALIRSFGSAHP